MENMYWGLSKKMRGTNLTNQKAMWKFRKLRKLLARKEKIERTLFKIIN